MTHVGDRRRLPRILVTGQFAQASQPLYRIADLRRVWLTVHAFERDAVQVSPGAQVRIPLGQALLDGLEAEFDGGKDLNDAVLQFAGHAAALGKLHARGYLQAIYMVIASLSNIRGLIEHANKLNAGER